jgi:excinuclease ABC subunit A
MLATFKQHKNRNIREELNILAQKGFVRVISINHATKDTLEPLRIEELLTLTDKDLKSKKSVIYWWTE